MTLKYESSQVWRCLICYWGRWEGNSTDMNLGKLQEMVRVKRPGVLPSVGSQSWTRTTTDRVPCPRLTFGRNPSQYANCISLLNHQVSVEWAPTVCQTEPSEGDCVQQRPLQLSVSYRREPRGKLKLTDAPPHSCTKGFFNKTISVSFSWVLKTTGINRSHFTKCVTRSPMHGCEGSWPLADLLCPIFKRGLRSWGRYLIIRAAFFFLSLSPDDFMRTLPRASKGALVVKNSPCKAGDTEKGGLHPWVGKIQKTEAIL